MTENANLLQRLPSMLNSRRFWMAVTGVVVVLMTDKFGLEEEQVKMVVATIASWILGDSLTKTGK